MYANPTNELATMALVFKRCGGAMVNMIVPTDQTRPAVVSYITVGLFVVTSYSILCICCPFSCKFCMKASDHPIYV